MVVGGSAVGTGGTDRPCAAAVRIAAGKVALAVLLVEERVGLAVSVVFAAVSTVGAVASTPLSLFGDA